jgi:hypothetical protein
MILSFLRTGQALCLFALDMSRLGMAFYAVLDIIANLQIIQFFIVFIMMAFSTPYFIFFYMFLMGEYLDAPFMFFIGLVFHPYVILHGFAGI